MEDVFEGAAIAAPRWMTAEKTPRRSRRAKLRMGSIGSKPGTVQKPNPSRSSGDCRSAEPRGVTGSRGTVNSRRNSHWRNSIRIRGRGTMNYYLIIAASAVALCCSSNALGQSGRDGALGQAPRAQAPRVSCVLQTRYSTVTKWKLDCPWGLTEGSKSPHSSCRQMPYQDIEPQRCNVCRDNFTGQVTSYSCQ
jgi:hypothetical protein